MLVYQRVADCLSQSEETDTVITGTLKNQSFKAYKKKKEKHRLILIRKDKEASAHCVQCI